jgi:hypothetical protein
MNCLWRPCLLMDRDEMSNLYRGPSIDATYQVSVHLAQWFQRRRFKKNRPIRNMNCLWRPCLLMDRDEMSDLYRGPSIDASYQVSVHLDEGFQRRILKCEKLTGDRLRTPSDGKSSHCLWHRWAKNGFSLKKNHLTTQISKRFASYRHFDRGNSGWSDRGSRSESGLVVF